jgi:hypothetical protein
LGRVCAGCLWGTTKPVPCRTSVSVSRAIICWDICSAGLVASNIIAEMDSRGCGPAHKSLLTFAVAALWLHEVVRWRLIRSRPIFNSKQVICEKDQQVMAIFYMLPHWPSRVRRRTASGARQNSAEVRPRQFGACGRSLSDRHRSRDAARHAQF